MLDLKMNFSLFLGGRKGKEYREQMLKEQAKKDRQAVVDELNKPKVEVTK